MKSFDFGGTGQPLHFLHANGFPPDCYKPLFELLKTEYHVFGMLLRPLWDDARREDVRSWIPFSDDLRSFLSSQPDPVIGVGHSVGAIATLRAAMREPKKFSALILLDPVLFIPKRLVEWRMQRAANPSGHPLIQGAMKRRRSFTDLESVFNSYRDRPQFRYVTDEHLRTYIEGMTQPSEDGGYELVYSPDWEAHIYYVGLQDFDIWNGLQNFNVPTLILGGSETDTFLEEAGMLVKQKQPRVVVEALDRSTHLLPLERPQEVFDIMQSFLKSEVVTSHDPNANSDELSNLSNLIV